jgi:hypothetical protein
MITEFTYNDKPRRLYEMRGSKPEFLEGIELTSMNEDEAAEFAEEVDRFEEYLASKMSKHYRRFTRAKMTGQL